MRVKGKWREKKWAGRSPSLPLVSPAYAWARVHAYTWDEREEKELRAGGRGGMGGKGEGRDGERDGKEGAREGR